MVQKHAIYKSNQRMFTFFFFYCSLPESEMNDYKWLICELWLCALLLPADTKSQRKKSKARCWLIQTLILLYNKPSSQL